MTQQEFRNMVVNGIPIEYTVEQKQYIRDLITEIDSRPISLQEKCNAKSEALQNYINNLPTE